MKNDIDLIVDAFEARTIKPQDFGHIDHIKVAYGMLDRYDFMTASHHYASTIKAMAESAGVPEKFNATITLAFMSLIAELKSNFVAKNFEAFLAAHNELVEKNGLSRWYSSERLSSSMARSQFLLPDRISEI